MLSVDGSRGEGGGQILRTALAVALCRNTPVRIRNIRARRREPGLGNQHLTAVKAAARLCDGVLEGAERGSTQVTLRPRGLRPGTYEFHVGTAGSTTLVLQTLLPPLLTAAGPSVLVISGGTHNPAAPPFDHLKKTFLPLLARMGASVKARLVRPGFHPAGGGRIEVYVEPVDTLVPFELIDRGPVTAVRGAALVSDLDPAIGERELRELARRLPIAPDALRLEVAREPTGPGNVVLVEVETPQVTEVFAGFGERGIPPEEIARRAATQATAFLDADVPIGPYAADQILLPLALAGGGAFRTVRPTPHAVTNAEVLKLAGLPAVTFDARPDGSWLCRVGGWRLATER